MRPYLRITLALLVAGAAATLALTSVVIGGYYYVEPGLPEARELRNIELKTPLRVYSRDGRLIGRFGEQIRAPVPYQQIPDIMIKAVLAAEDDQFFEHPGFDYAGTGRAILKFIVTGGSTDIAGGSTITQQVARENFLSRDRTLARKFREVIVAMRIEREFTKEEILSLYLNTYFFGQRSYGVAAAAQTYFDKPLSELSISDAAIIAGIAQGPSIWNPVYSPENAAARRAYVLRRLLELGDISRAEYDAALAEPIDGEEHGPEIELSAPYVAEMVRTEMLALFGPEAQTAGLRVTTTIDSRLQNAANGAVKRALVAYDERHGYRGPIGQIEGFGAAPGALPEPDIGDGPPQPAGEDAAPFAADTDEDRWRALLADYEPEPGMEAALVLDVGEDAAGVYLRTRGRRLIGFDAVDWAAPYIDDDSVGSRPKTLADVLSPGDIVRFAMDADGRLRLAQLPDVQGAFVSLDPKDGAVTALVGGLDYGLSAFNRATQSLRQPGSAFKPFIYSAALENGFTAATIINDAPVVIESSELETVWRPKNYDGRWNGETRLREALVGSLNSVAVRVIRKAGIGNTIRHLRNFGFAEQALPRNAGLALGVGGIAPLDLAAGYAILANGGYRVEPYFIDRVENADGEVLFSADADLKLACIDYAAPPSGAGLEFSTPIAAGGETCEAAADAERPSDDALGAVAATESAAAPLGEPVEIVDQARRARRVVSEQNVYLIADMMRDVVRRGSGARAWRALRRGDLSGKTGTASDERDTWFSGFNADIVATAWVGFDDRRQLGRGEQGGVTAIPIWIDFMAEALAGQPERARPQPPGIVEVRINPDNGLIASDASPDAIFEKFRIGHIPEREPDPAYSLPRIDARTEERARSGNRIF